MKIGEASKKCGLPIKTVRYYADVGLISPARRDNQYRDFDAKTINSLILIGRARALDFSISECKEILELAEASAANSKTSDHNSHHLISKLRKRRCDVEELEKLFFSVARV